MPSNLLRNSLIYTVLIFLALVLIACLGFPFLLDLGIVCIGLLIVRFRVTALLKYVSIYVLLTLVVAEVFLSANNVNPYYRPQDKWAHVDVNFFSKHEKKYVPNIYEEFDSPHGDIVALDLEGQTRHLANPRRVLFQTDEHGYRNAPNTSVSADILLVGDSFVAGDGLDQADTLSSQIRLVTGSIPYSLAYPDGPSGYYERMIARRGLFRDKVETIVFYFEGNDFDYAEETGTGEIVAKGFRSLLTKQAAAKGAYARLLSQTFGLKSPAFINNLVIRALASPLSRNANPVFAEYVQGLGSSGFYKSYSRNLTPARVVNATLIQAPSSLSEHFNIRCAVLIPSKERVYLDQQKKPRASPYLTHVLNAYSNHSGVKVIDLLPFFDSAIQKNPYRDLFWSDDTHWNPNGVKVTVEALKLSGCFKD